MVLERHKLQINQNITYLCNFSNKVLNKTFHFETSEGYLQEHRTNAKDKQIILSLRNRHIQGVFNPLPEQHCFITPFLLCQP